MPYSIFTLARGQREFSTRVIQVGRCRFLTGEDSSGSILIFPELALIARAAVLFIRDLSFAMKHNDPVLSRFLSVQAAIRISNYPCTKYHLPAKDIYLSNSMALLELFWFCNTFLNIPDNHSQLIFEDRIQLPTHTFLKEDILLFTFHFPILSSFPFWKVRKKVKEQSKNRLTGRHFIFKVNCFSVTNLKSTSL